MDNVGGVSGVFRGAGSPLKCSLPSQTDWEDLQESSLPQHPLQGSLHHCVHFLKPLLWVRSSLVALAVELDACAWLSSQGFS